MIDNTNQFRQNGTIILKKIPSDWVNQSIPTVSSSDYYWMRIKRQKNSLTTVPIEKTIKIASIDDIYYWNSRCKSHNISFVFFAANNL